MGPASALGPDVNCYSMGKIEIGAYVVVSQGAYLCTGTHRIHDESFKIYAKPIYIGDNAWLAADSFVGPGVKVGEGAVLAARAAAFEDLDAWTIYLGNPAKVLKKRTPFVRR